MWNYQKEKKELQRKFESRFEDICASAGEHSSVLQGVVSQVTSALLDMKQVLLADEGDLEMEVILVPAISGSACNTDTYNVPSFEQ